MAAFLQSVWASLEAVWGPLAALGGFFAFLSAVFTIAGPILQDSRSFEQIQAWARKPGLGARYGDLIAASLRGADRFYGQSRCLSLRGYGACLIVALIYPLFLWQLAWALGGPLMITGETVFSDTVPAERRWFGLSAC